MQIPEGSKSKHLSRRQGCSNYQLLPLRAMASSNLPFSVIEFPYYSRLNSHALLLKHSIRFWNCYSVRPGLESCSSRCIWFCNPSSRLQPHSGCNKLDLITANHWNRIHNLNLRSPLIWLKDSGASNFLTLVLPELCLGVTEKWAWV